MEPKGTWMKDKERNEGEREQARNKDGGKQGQGNKMNESEIIFTTAH